jgi:predicted metal-dependent HD superfamily phosphohydrolase
LAQQPALIAAAIWYHDAVYDTYRDDNEERSAALAQAELEAAGWAAALAGRVADMVRATRHHNADEGDTDTLLFLDFDLSILGSGPPLYDTYCAAIRAEFNWVAEADYRRGRSRVLQSFLQREAIYRTPLLRDAWESAARLNLTRELSLLAASA